MKKIFASFFLSAAALSQSPAASVFYDSFDYSPTGDQLSSAGSSFWSLRNTTAQVDPTIGAGSLSYPGLQTASGDNSIVFNGTNASGVSGRLLGDVYNSSNAPTVYYSLTFQVTSIAAGDWGLSGNWLTGSFMMGFTQDAGVAVNNPNVAAPLLIRTGDPTNASGNANDFPEFQLGTGVTAVQNTATRVFDSTRNYLPNTTLFLVLAYTFGPNTTDDVARLWVNPIPGSLESANIPVVTTTGLTDVANNQVQGFFLRNNTVEPASTTIDDLRVGTTWADVTPVPEPSTIALVGLGVLGLMRVRRSRR